jgi:hypothetical protein
MEIRKFGHFVIQAWMLGGTLIVMNTAALAQASQDANSAPASATAENPATAPAATSTTPAAPAVASTPAATPGAPSAETIKKAKQAGMHAEVNKNGMTLFCWEDATVGTRFKTKKCVDQSQVDAVALQRQAAKDQISHSIGCSGCGGGK